MPDNFDALHLRGAIEQVPDALAEVTENNFLAFLNQFVDSLNDGFYPSLYYD